MLSLPLQISVYDDTAFPGNSGTLSSSTFGVLVKVGGEDYTDRLIGEVEVDAEEGAARVATFAVVAREGVFEPDTWINLPVSIDYIQDGVSFRLFTGIVDLPTLSIDDESIVVNCTDDLQARFEGKERAQIEALFQGTGAQWSQALFGDYEDSERFADDLLSTIPISADLDRNGNLVFGNWYAAGYDFLFSDAETFPESVAVEWGGRREIINRVSISLEYTYQFFRERSQRYVWSYPRPFPEYLEQNTSLPNNDMVTQAAGAGGWTLDGPISYDRLPASGEIDLPSGGSTQWVVSEEVRQYVVLGTDFTLKKRWVQDVKQTLNLTVESAANIARYDLLTDEIEATLDTSIDEEGFGDFDTTPNLTEITIGSDTAWSSYDAAEYTAAIDASIAHGQVIILESFRQNSVSFQTLLQPELERYHFIRLQANTVTAQGKCRRLTHRISLESGSATTEVDLAVFRGENTIAGSYMLPSLSYSEATRATTTNLGTAIQKNDGSVTTPAADFEGYVGNELPIATSAPFDERFAIKTPDIADTSRDAVEESFDITVQADMYNQTLTVSL
jgi:hypothetical protein